MIPKEKKTLDIRFSGLYNTPCVKKITDFSIMIAKNRLFQVFFQEEDGTEDWITAIAPSLGKALKKIAAWYPNIEPTDVADHGSL